MRSRLTLPSTAVLVFAVLAALLVSGTSTAMFKNSTRPVPVDRLLENVRKHIEADPTDAQGHYVLGRIHAMLYAKEVDTLKLEPGALPGFPAWESVLVRRAKGPLSDGARRHLVASILRYRQATELDREDAKTRLALGWMLENGALFVAEIGSPPDEPERKLAAGVREAIEKRIAALGAEDSAARDAAESELRKGLDLAIRLLADARNHEDLEIRRRVRRLLVLRWEDRALAAYRTSFALALPHDRGKRYYGPAADSAISLEAGKGILRLLEGRTLTTEERKEADRVREEVAGLDAKGRAITPIVFPASGPGTLASLVDPDRTVEFDLDGDDRLERWPWLRPGTALVVWDPGGTGRITSGRQLFGSATWWIAWRNGYEPLALLDDDRDGRVAGRELRGLAVWVDRDGNGVSDPGEVVTARRFGIESIAVRGIERIDGVPAHAAGIRMLDGTTRPTYDWIVRPR